MAAEMEDRDAVSILLKDGVDPPERGFLLDHDVRDQPALFQLLELILQRPSLDFNRRQIGSCVGECEEYDGSVRRHKSTL
jgi:hypothetical protein